MLHQQQQALIAYLSGFVNEQRQILLKQILDQRTRHLTVVLKIYIIHRMPMQFYVPVKY